MEKEVNVINMRLPIIRPHDHVGDISTVFQKDKTILILLYKIMLNFMQEQ